MNARETKTTDSKPVVLVCGEDEFAVKQRARQRHRGWVEGMGGFDHEIVDAAAANTSEALKALVRLREALQTLPFFGGGKVVWFQNCNFLGDERTASSQAVTEQLGLLVKELGKLPWENLRLLISAGKVDRRKSFYKGIEKLGAVELHNGWPSDESEWMKQAEASAAEQLSGLGKKIDAEALAKLAASVGPHPRQLHSEVEKLALYAGDRAGVRTEDVDAIVTRNKQAKAFALGDAVGERDLGRVLTRLDEELWEMQGSSRSSEIGILYGLITKVRSMLFAKEMAARGWIKAELDFSRFKAQLQQVPLEGLPSDKRFNPLAMNPYVLYRAARQSKNYTSQELVRAMEELLECNRKLIFGESDEGLVLQQALARIVQRDLPVGASKR